MGVDGAGDWERGEGALDDNWGGPFAQADFAGSGVGFFGALAVVHLLLFFFLLILQRGEGEKKEKKEYLPD